MWVNMLGNVISNIQILFGIFYIFFTVQFKGFLSNTMVLLLKYSLLLIAPRISHHSQCVWGCIHLILTWFSRYEMLKVGDWRRDWLLVDCTVDIPPRERVVWRSNWDVINIPVIKTLIFSQLGLITPLPLKTPQWAEETDGVGGEDRTGGH